MEKRAAELEAEVAKRLSAAEAADSEEDTCSVADARLSEISGRHRARLRPANQTPDSATSSTHDNLDGLLGEHNG